MGIMIMSLRSKLGRTLVIGLAGLSALATARAAEPSYKLALTVPLGGADRWDYLSADPATHHVFIAHGTEATVVDGRTGTIAGRIGGLDGAHSIVTVPESRHGYANSGKRSTMTEFDLDSLKPLKEIAIGTGSDAMIYDPASKRVFVMLGEAGNVAVVDTATDTLAATIPGRRQAGISGLGRHRQAVHQQ
jgi:DNA-binding beta-propeller fold protein YncE